MKKTLIIIGAVIGMIVVIAVAFLFRYQQMARTITNEPVPAIDLKQIEDGVYSGEYGEFLVFVKVSVTIEDHGITNIGIIDQRSGPGYEALETIGRILAKQSPDVDAVSGATWSSKSIMIAVRNALTGQ